MTQVADIITQAMRENNLISALQEQTPKETTEALNRLQALVLSSLGGEVGYIMEDWNVNSAASIVKPSGVPLSSAQAAAFTVPPQARLVCNLAATLTVTLDQQPQDGQRFSVIDAANTFDTFALTVNPNGRKMEGTVGNRALNTEGLSKQWLYRSDLADWKVIDPLTTAMDMPFPADFDDYFIIMLAMRMNPRYGQTLQQESMLRLQQQREQFIVRYSQSRLRTQVAAAVAEK